MIGKRIKALREELGISQADLADAFQVSRMTVNNYENEKRVPDIDFAMNAADYFQVTVEYLTGRSEFRDKEDFNATIQKVQYLADVVDTLPTEQGRQMTNALAELLKIAKNHRANEPLMPLLSNSFIQLAQLILSYGDLAENMGQSADALKSHGLEDELIAAVLKEKPMSLYGHGMIVAGNLHSFVQMFTGQLADQMGLVRSGDES